MHVQWDVAIGGGCRVLASSGRPRMFKVATVLRRLSLGIAVVALISAGLIPPTPWPTGLGAAVFSQAGRVLAAPSPAVSPPRNLENVSLRLDWLPTGYHAPFFLALARGYYAGQGLAVDIQDGRGSSLTVKLVGAGTATFGLASLATMSLAVAEGAPLRAVAGIIQKMPDGIISLVEADIRSPKDLEGKRMAFTPGSSSELLFPAFALAAGVDDSKVVKITLEAGARLTTLLQGRADFMADWAFTQVPVIKAQGRTPSVILYADYGVNVLGHGLVTTIDVIKSRPAVVQGFVAASIRGIEEALNDPQAAVDAMLKYRQDLNRDLLTEQLKGLRAHLHTKNSVRMPTGRFSRADWAATVDLLVKYMGIKRSVAIDELFTNDFIPRR